METFIHTVTEAWYLIILDIAVSIFLYAKLRPKKADE
jgi:hypothetical protein